MFTRTLSPWMSVGSMDGLGMKNAWNRNVRIKIASRKAMRIRPGSSPRKPRTPAFVGLRDAGSGASSDWRSPVFIG